MRCMCGKKDVFMWRSRGFLNTRPRYAYGWAKTLERVQRRIGQRQVSLCQFLNFVDAGHVEHDHGYRQSVDKIFDEFIQLRPTRKHLFSSIECAHFYVFRRNIDVIDYYSLIRKLNLGMDVALLHFKIQHFGAQTMWSRQNSKSNMIDIEW